MVSRAIGKVVSGCVLLIFIAHICFAQGKSENKRATTSADSPSGVQLYNQHCVACHGTDLKGAGPFPPPYRTPPDLTMLTQRHGGKFPSTYVSKVLRNGVTLPAHGPAEMPVWGAEFAATNRLDESQIATRIRNLANYLKIMQNLDVLRQQEVANMQNGLVGQFEAEQELLVARVGAGVVVRRS